jgi:uncharacterized protein (TIGR03435 family)
MLALAITGQLAAAQETRATSPTFEVSAVRVSRNGDIGSGSSFKSGRFTATNVSLKNVMEYSAFGIPEARIVGGPSWLGSARFDIEAKLDAETARQLDKLGREQRQAEIHAAVQQLLADRFKLAFHWETREMPIYALVVAKSGSRLHAAAKPEEGTGTSASGSELTAEGITMDGLARTLTQELSGELGRVVVNQTGIMGKYDLTLKWTPESVTNSGVSGDAPPSIFTAVQEQLGLKLESSRGPVQVLVIDRAEMPTEN